MMLPREEMAFRKEYETFVTQRKLTTVFRPGNRIYPNFRGYKPAEIITARVIEKPGCDQDKIAPVFNEIRMPIQIAEIHTLDIQKLTPSHFEGSSPDVQNVHDLINHLEYIYGKKMTAFGHEVTRICFKYLDAAPNQSQIAGQAT
ncbi:MAG: hypothetical protein ACI9HA_001476 [Dinoroseobacter sp.]|jgi:hypothetical protein